MPLDALRELPRRSLVADFHCVTTWTREAVRWSGFSFRDFYELFLLTRIPPGAAIACVELRALDGYRSTLPLEDALRDNVLLADRLDDRPLPLEHGAPLRLVASDHYGCKNVKQLSRIGVGERSAVPPVGRFTRAHPRARVALEERGQLLGPRFYRILWAMMGPTL
jgi:DMSO/TMAO reductase YedYZ molybdopterin-dependent catalytic subunit